MMKNKIADKIKSKKTKRICAALISIIMLLSLSLVGCDQAQKGAGDTIGGGNAQNAPGATTDKADYVSISAEEAKEIMDANSEAIILDVRTQQEFDGGHIPRAICVPVETIGAEPPSELPDKDATILVYCRSGNRSKQAAEKLVDLGYTDIREFGGISSWPYEITK